MFAHGYARRARILAYFAFPAAVAVAEFFVDNPFVSVMTSLSVSQFWNLGLMQVASVTGVVGVSFIVTSFASVANYIWEEGLRKATILYAVCYGVVVVAITGIGMTTIEKITTTDQTVKVAAGIEDLDLLLEDKSILAQYEGSDEEKLFQAFYDILNTRAKQAVQNGAALLVFPEEAFGCSEASSEAFIEQAQGIAKENGINILLPLLRDPENGKEKNTLNFIDSNGQLLNTYLKNHLVPVVEEPNKEKGDGKTPVIEVDGVKYTYLICADYTSNKYAYNGREADIFINPSYDWKAFQYFTSYGVQARAIECGFSVLRNPVDGNIVLYDVFGRPLHMQNVMNVHTGIVYLDIPIQGRQTIYGATGNWFPWICAIYIVFAILSGIVIKLKQNHQ